jgi:hypothetical protein
VEAKILNKVFVDVSLSFSHVLLLSFAKSLGMFYVPASCWICQYSLVFLRGYAMDVTYRLKRVGRSKKQAESATQHNNGQLQTGCTAWERRHRESKESSRCHMRWVAQVSESRPIASLTSMSEDEMTLVVSVHCNILLHSAPMASFVHSPTLSPPKRRA